MDIAKTLRLKACSDPEADYAQVSCTTLFQAAVEVERLRAAIAAIQQATLDGKVCDDVAWFSRIETLHDYCDRVLNHTADQAQLV